MPANRDPNPEDTARVDLRDLEASADAAERHLLLMTIGADELPLQADSPKPAR